MLTYCNINVWEMGKILSTIKHPFRNFNLESRAHKIIGQSKPIPAPKFEKDELDLQRLQKQYPEVFKEGLRKDEQLDQHLKDVYVVSHDPVSEIKQPQNPNRPLPQDRSQPDMYLFGHKEPEKVPLGKILLRNALKFISQHQGDPKLHTAENISKVYKLPESTVSNILKYYRVFEIYVPENVKKTKGKFAAPSKPSSYVTKDISKLLPSSDFNKKNDS
ncbi:NADH dehydrogenase [ubiquinone] 1 alpha subcomplex assembly factor 4 [Rhynchophorus ferrugineus]|uniref:NADH dehydrogenase [ubiquinone] 1 alpha subcomplex assembly factor 4 n=1 Tax=Rhynchophorus ferrugineus TaxID=354439 RepID=UPI003FCEACA7